MIAILLAGATAALLPSALRLRMPFGEPARLRSECETWAPSPLVYAQEAESGWDIMRAGFAAVSAARNLTLAFPAASSDEMLTALAELLNSNSCRLDGLRAAALPGAPAPMLRLTVRSGSEGARGRSADETAAVFARTREWVDSRLVRQRLCPFTASSSKAAAGLDMVDVAPGPIAYRISGAGGSRAAALACAFWAAACEVASTPERELSTVLLMAPEFDDDFGGFVEVCDRLVQPSVQLASAEELIGRAWFHPSYDADAVGHAGVVAGHAVPHTLVAGFFEKVGAGPAPPPDALARANNEIRRTPHATLNLLRRSQLRAAQRFEASTPSAPPPNSVYVRNVQRVLRDGRRSGPAG